MQKFKDFTTIKINAEKPLAAIYLNRPEVHNAFNDVLINELSEAFTFFSTENDCRVIVLSGEGRSFCAGADLNWMKSVVNYSFEQNLGESVQLAELLSLIHNHPKPVIARINGSAIGGGVGLISVCDILISADSAKFALSEVSLGLAPAVISPYLIERLGYSNTRLLFLTGKRITAAEALDYGLINQIVPFQELDNAVEHTIASLLNNSPDAIAKIKELLYTNTILSGDELMQYTAKLIAELRISPEGQEGMNAYLEKRSPFWKINYQE